MKKVAFITILFFLVPFLAVSEGKSKSKQTVAPLTIGNSILKGFDKCKFSQGFSEVREKLFSTRKPIEKFPDSWTYAIRSKIMGLPVKGIAFGVCGSDGSQDCGFVDYTALIIPKPLKEARAYLKKKTGIDFTETEGAENEEGIIIRPVLTVSNLNSDESVLYCDSFDH